MHPALSVKDSFCVPQKNPARSKHTVKVSRYLSASLPASTLWGTQCQHQIMRKRMFATWVCTCESWSFIWSPLTETRTLEPSKRDVGVLWSLNFLCLFIIFKEIGYNLMLSESGCPVSSFVQSHGSLPPLTCCQCIHIEYLDVCL